MTKYHINDNGVAGLCVAQGECPITKKTNGEHYNSKTEAQQAYESIMQTSVINKKSKTKKASKNKSKGKKSGSPKSTIYAPDKPVIIQPTLDEAQELVDRAKNQLTKNGRKSFPKVLKGKIIAYGLMGSSIYNLHHPDSDRDVVVITDTPKGQDFHHVFEEDGSDVRVMSGFNFAEKVMEGTPPNVDLFMSGQLHMDKNSPYHPYFSALRVNELGYLDKIGRHTRADIKNAFKDKSQKRANKSIKTALRNSVIHERFINKGYLRVEFTDTEREKFYKSYSKLLKWTETMKSKKEDYTDKEFDNLINEKIISCGRENLS